MSFEVKVADVLLLLLFQGSSMRRVQLDSGDCAGFVVPVVPVLRLPVIECAGERLKLGSGLAAKSFQSMAVIFFMVV